MVISFQAPVDCRIILGLYGMLVEDNHPGYHSSAWLNTLRTHYPLVKIQKQTRKPQFLMGNLSIYGPFSIAILNYRSLKGISGSTSEQCSFSASVVPGVRQHTPRDWLRVTQYTPGLSWSNGHVSIISESLLIYAESSNQVFASSCRQKNDYKNTSPSVDGQGWLNKTLFEYG